MSRGSDSSNQFEKLSGPALISMCSALAFGVNQHLPGFSFSAESTEGGRNAMTKRRLRLPAIVVLVVLMAAGCSSGGKKGGGTAAGATSSTSSKPPQSGGTINFGTFSETAGLDPIVSTGNGVTGFIEMAAIYDTIVRYNVKTGKYENNTAESVTNNADYTEWTLKLKPNIKFTDGTDYDAAAVAFGMNRHRSGIPGAPPCAQLYACPGNLTSSTAYMALVKDIQVVDNLTAEIHLNPALGRLRVRAVGRAEPYPIAYSRKEMRPHTKRPSVQLQHKSGRCRPVQDRLLQAARNDLAGS